MTTEEKKTVLMRYRNLVNEIDFNFERLARLKSFSTRVTSNYSYVSVCSNNVSDNIQLYYEKLEALSVQIRRDIKNLIDLRAEIELSISSLEDSFSRELLWSRYILGKTFHELGESFNYCSRQIIRLHINALNKLELPDRLLEL